jgi:hypothetical protein
MTSSKKAVTLSLNLSDPNFIGLGRRKYTEKYTVVPVKAYPEEVKTAFNILYQLVGLELTDETACISVLASEEGFPQRLIGPKVFQVEGILNLKIGSELYPFTKTQTEDEVKYTLNGKALALQAEGKQPVFKLTLGSGYAIKLPIYINKNELAAEGENPYYTFADLEETLAIYENEALIKTQVGSPSTGGKTLFSALKYLPELSYNVLSAKNESGKYGAVLAMQVSPTESCIITVQDRNPQTEKWELAETSVEPGTVIKIQGNTALKNSLMGSELTVDDNVILKVTSKSENKEGNTVVSAFFDYSNSRLKFEF